MNNKQIAEMLAGQRIAEPGNRIAALRLALKRACHHKRDALWTISAVTGVSRDRLKLIRDGIDNPTEAELSWLEVHMGTK